LLQKLQISKILVPKANLNRWPLNSSASAHMNPAVFTSSLSLA